MRAIQKGPEPRELIQWRQDNADTPDNLHYEGGGFPGEAVRKALLKEQFHLCGYTMKSLKSALECEQAGRKTTFSCHIEHLLPQARKIAAETIDYANMLACYPPSDSKVACAYGAPVKGSYDPSLKPFVSPLTAAPERHFAFDAMGNISGVTPEGMATVQELTLDHATLVRDRKAVIGGWLEPKTGRPISAAAARRVAAEVMVPHDDRLHPYCVAVAQAALVYAERLERRAARLRRRVER
jgi:hypothetical protein